MAYEVEVKRLATFVNEKVDLLGELISEPVEQQMFETVFGVLVNLLPETKWGLPVRALVVGFAMRFVKDPEAVGHKMVTTLSAMHTEAG